ncbi:D-2-hydroxyacid dehydrogenase [Hydrocarboniclastica marina]|uniref:D-2-hydroxyacid dehydrogenase n=1 Tax=Hydrocarboniclastica marina TaxID=2259620 RepID=A0A4P7XDQ3_9ALTE|nr:D-2-hydroxyacid dehydrogenase [Hydrocarboniclastica marina]MAL99551.1 glycerate dehydrogenase [Alteromonadaceae bacterium]QCF25039.1 D-2-hydroxyacid dehydrogenase [Hydrocarboniclastica marina]
MRAVFLDTRTMGMDISLQPLAEAVDELTCWEMTSPEQVTERLQGREIALVNKVVLDERHFSAAPDLKLVAVTATGLNNIDLEAAAARDIQVKNVSGYARPSIVQHTFTLLFALANNLLRYDGDVRQGRWAQSDMFCLLDHPMRELAGKTIGIVGYGDLGQGVAAAAKAFGMNVLVAARSGQLTPDRIPLKTLLPQVDVLSVNCLLSEETRNLIDREALRALPETAFVINTARGGIVDEAALAEALRNGWIAGAGVDVLSEEPPRNGNPLLADDIPNLIVTPHCAWGTREARERIVALTAENLHRFTQDAAD